ncbi:hypothetical protein [Streptomyces sp. WAC05950]|uniref:hypothetical protein n=1 Tax=Streptomyces sp. WAC05950 TaxID=2487419 RepID=UPI000F736118|nr:hypothetical protein [Streptomyces sp. WAC05950]RST13474.1 hypothetical protein EF904_07270 [Streptomyces sp. WAC05950]
MTTVLDVIALLVLAASLWQLISYSRWQRLECAECGMTMRFRCVSRAEQKRLTARMQAHVAGHEQKEQDQ